MALDLTGYKLTFNDDFNSFNSNYSGVAGQGTWATSYHDDVHSLTGNGEHEFYIDPTYKGLSSTPLGINPFSVVNDASAGGNGSVLQIEAKPTDWNAKQALWGYDYTSGVITTMPSFSQTYGYFEMRAKLPEGSGFWPAFWLLAKDKSWPPELDPLEAFGGPAPDGQGGVTKYHWGNISSIPGAQSGNWVDVGTDMTKGYHTYGLDWQKDYLTYYFDGKEVAKVATPPDADKPMYLIANLAVGGNWPGMADGRTAHMDVDYIRAYSKDANAVAVASNPAPASSGTGTSGATTPSAGTTSAATGSTTGTGTTTIKLHISEDAYQGDAQFTVKVDGVNVGTYTAHAAHGSGQWEDVTVTGNFGAAGPNKVDVTFLNDAWGGGWPNDRNLYVDYIDVNGHKVRGESQASATVNGSAAALYGNGTLSFDTHGSAPAASSGTSTVLSTTTTAPAATPSPSTTTGSTTTTSGTPVIAKLDAVATPAGAHAYVPPDWSGVTKGSAGADDLYTSGAHQTLIGNGGDDIFHIGTNIDAKIVVGSTGVTTVSTWAPAYTLADGVNDLKAEGDYVHNLTGNAGHNWITGGNGNDVLNGGAGNDVLQVGTGANQLTGGAGNDMFIFSKAADHDNVIHDFARGQDMLDLRGAVASTGYNGADAVKDGILKLAAAGDGTVISIDSDGANGQPAHTLVTIEHVAPSALKAGADFLWH